MMGREGRMKLTRSAISWGAAALLMLNGATGAVVAPAQVSNTRQQWSVIGLRLVSPLLAFDVVAADRMRLKFVSTRDETVEIEAAGFSTEPTTGGLAVRARHARITGSGARVPLRDATFELTLSREGVISVWASGEAAR
jgi:hypothetical protein